MSMSDTTNECARFVNVYGILDLFCAYFMHIQHNLIVSQSWENLDILNPFIV